MHLFLIRHAEAIPLGSHGIDCDEKRPLTENGRAQSRALAAMLARINERPGKLLTSPLLRAEQTAEVIAATWANSTPVEICEQLTPGSKKRKLLREILAVEGDELGLIGHNPDLSELLGWFLGEKLSGLELQKAGVACVSFDGPPQKGSGALVWLVTPSWYPVLPSSQ